MGTFRHTPDDVIYINNTTFPLAFFLTQEPAYTLPGTYTSRYYEQTVSHYVSDASDSLGQVLAWTDGDTYITNEATYAAAYQDSLYTLQQVKDMRKGEADAYSTTIKEGAVSVAAVIYDSDTKTLRRLELEHAKFTRDGAVPGGHYVTDASGTQQALNLAAHEDVVDRIIDLYYACDLNFDAHAIAIQALTTKVAVAAYDFTTGWPSVPY